MTMNCFEILEKKGIKYNILFLSSVSVSFKDVLANSQEINEKEICKTIVLKNNDGKQFALFLRGKDKIDFKKIKDIFGKSKILTKEELKKETGKDAGEICPILLKIPIFVEKKVLENEKINFGSGNLTKGVEIKKNDLSKAFKFEIKEFAEV